MHKSRSAAASRRGGLSQVNRGWRILPLGALAILYALRYQPVAIGHVTIPALRDVVPPVVAGVPVSIPWFGALGAVLIGCPARRGEEILSWQAAQIVPTLPPATKASRRPPLHAGRLRNGLAGSSPHPAPCEAWAEQSEIR